MREAIRNLDKPLLIISVILFVIGLIMIFSASNISAFMRYSTSPYNFFIRQSAFLVGSVIVSLFALPIKTTHYKNISTLALYAIGAVLVFLLVYGTAVNDSVRWVNLGFFSILPSQFATVITIIFLASYYEHKKESLDNYMTVLYPIGCCVMIAGTIFFQPDFGTAVIYTLIVSSMFFLTPVAKEIRNKILLFMVSVVLIFVLIFTTAGNSLISPRQKARFDFSDPCSAEKFYGIGNQVCNSYLAINNGGLMGVGLGNSTQKYLYLPEAHTDFIYAITAEEIGFIGSVGLMLLYFLLLGRIIRIAKKAINLRGYLICMGTVIFLAGHILINLGGVTGLIPLTGIPLPFMSYGGTFAVSVVMALTFVQRVNIENRIAEGKVQKRKENVRKISRF